MLRTTRNSFTLICGRESIFFLAIPLMSERPPLTGVVLTSQYQTDLTYFAVEFGTILRRCRCMNKTGKP